MSGKLDKAVCYLSGAIEAVADHGVGWRREFISKVHQAGINIDFIDPTNKPGVDGIKIQENKAHQEALKSSGCWAELREYVKSYRRLDLRYVDNSDFVVAAIDTRVPQWGTSNEVYMAETEQRPIFFLCEGGMAKMPNWLFALVELEPGERRNVFSDLDSLVAELKLYDSGTIPMDDRWVLLRKLIEDGRKSKTA